jgi:hypothetical protein
MEAYSSTVERMMKRLYRSLRENDRRRYAAIEATKLGHGGIEYIARLLGCDSKTVRQGIAELEAEDELDPERVRKKGGGRKRLIDTIAKVSEVFLQVLRDHTAGDPMNPDVKWTNLSRRQIARRMTDMGMPVSRRIVRQLLEQHGYRRRKAVKKVTMGSHPDRNAQFEAIARLKVEYRDAGLPVLSIDTKKKELLGNFHRPGQTYTQQGVETFDHDFPSAGQGKLIPHGIYDLTHAHAAIHLNTSHDTGELCCDSIALWWEEHGRAAYPQAKRLLILCDGGGSNSATHYLFKEDLQRLADRLGWELRVAHYPPYCSKHNPIEHRVFPHVTRACQGVIFHTMEIAKQFIERAKTNTGLRVTVSILNKAYETGRKYAEGFKENLKIAFDDHLPKWNYRALPQTE